MTASTSSSSRRAGTSSPTPLAPTDPKAPGAAAADSLTGILDALEALAQQNRRAGGDRGSDGAGEGEGPDAARGGRDPAGSGGDGRQGRVDEEGGEGGHHGGKVKVGDMVGAFGTRSYGPFLIVPALLEISPIGAVPGVPTVLATMVVLFAAQMLFGAKRLWVPGFIERARFSARRLERGVHTLRPLARRVDGWFHGRLRRLTTGPFMRVAAAGCIALAVTVPLLEVVPFASSIPMAAIALFGLALLVGDGLLMLGACALALGAVGAFFAV